MGAGRRPAMGVLGARLGGLIGMLWVLVAARLCSHLCLNPPSSGSPPIGCVLEWLGQASRHLHRYFCPSLSCHVPASQITSRLNLALDISCRVVELTGALCPAHSCSFSPAVCFLPKLRYCHLIASRKEEKANLYGHSATSNEKSSRVLFYHGFGGWNVI